MPDRAHQMAHDHSHQPKPLGDGADQSSSPTSENIAVSSQALRRPSAPVLNQRTILALQRTIGNRAVTRTINKARLGSAEDAERKIQESSPDEAVSKALQSQGQPFPSELGQKIGGRLGADLHDVSVHTGSDSTVAAKAVGARAFTVGKDIHFDEGQYAPHTPEGQRLLTHEAVHTVQQTEAARSSSTLEISDPSDPAELEAESISAALQGDLSAEHVVVDPASYRPGTVEGRHLLAHELAHVRQARATPSVLRRQPASPASPTQPPGNQTSADPQPAKVKALVQQKDPTPAKELWTLISANALDNKPAPALGPITGGGAHNTHKWTLRVELKANLGFQGTVRGKTDPETVSTAPGTTAHDIHIAINKFLASSAEELAAHPDLQERMNFMAAEALMHELTHARLEVDKSLASIGVAAGSAVGTQLQSLQAKRAAAATEEADLKARIGSLIGAAGAAVGSPILSPSNTANFVNEEVNHVVEEKFAKQTAGMAFGLGPSIANAEVSSVYGDQLAKSVIELAINVDFRKGDALKTQRQWDNFVDIVKAAIKVFYDKLDAPATPATPGAQPRPAPSPTAPPPGP